MGIQKISLERPVRPRLNRTVLMNGTQALVRLMLMQKERDRGGGSEHGGAGHRLSRLTARRRRHANDTRRRSSLKDASDVTCSSTRSERRPRRHRALGQRSTAELRGEGKFDGVFGLWYGKGPGVDRTGDVFPPCEHGGHLHPWRCACSRWAMTIPENPPPCCHQSDWSLLDRCYHSPVRQPRGRAGNPRFRPLRLSRSAASAGVWVGLKTDEGHQWRRPPLSMAALTGCSWSPIRSSKRPSRRAQHPPRMIDWIRTRRTAFIGYKRFAAEAFSATRTSIDKPRLRQDPGPRSASSRRARTGSIWCWALDALGHRRGRWPNGLASRPTRWARPGRSTWPGFNDWAEDSGAHRCRRGEAQADRGSGQRGHLSTTARGRRVYGWYKDGEGSMHREELFPTALFA